MWTPCSTSGFHEFSIAIIKSLRHPRLMRNQITRLLLVFVVFTLSINSHALDLRSALELGVTASPELKQAKSQKKEYEAQAWQYKSEIFPTLNAVGTTDRRLNSGATRGVTSLSNDPFSTYSVGLELEQPIFTGLALVSGWKLANTVDDRADDEYFSSQQGIVKNLILAFYSYAESQEIFTAARGNLSTLEEYQKTLTYYARIGRGREMDRLQASVNTSVAAVELKNVEQERLDAELNLKKLINWTANGPLDVTSEVHVSKHSTQKTKELADAAVDSLVERALKNNPVLKMREKEVRQSDYLGDVELASDLPSLSFVGTYGSLALDREDLFENQAEYYSYGLRLTIPLFSGLSSVGKRREVKERTFQAERAYEVTKRDLRTQIISAQMNLRKSFQQYLDLKDVSTRSARALDLATRSYKQGTTSSQDVVNFQRSRYEADRILILNQYTYLRALLDLQELLGIDLYKTYTGVL